jgi:hypothetical protein
VAACANTEKAAITVRGRSLWLIGKWRLKGVKAATEAELRPILS